MSANSGEGRPMANKMFRALRLVDLHVRRRMYPEGRWAAALVQPTSGEKIYWVGEPRTSLEEAESDANHWEDVYNTAKRAEAEDAALKEDTDER